MIRVCADEGGAEVSRLVFAALQRSVGMAQVTLATCEDDDGEADITVAVDPDDNAGKALVEWCGKRGRKLIVLGRLSAALAKEAGARNGAFGSVDPSWARSADAKGHRPAESAATVQYSDLASRLSGQPWRRPFERFDFADEWNNHGYGAIRADGSIWAIAEGVRLPAEAELASVRGPGGAPLASYAGLFAVGGSQVLWFNRPVGPIDSFEWWLVETFLSSFMGGSHVCQPVLGDIPFGHDAAITMRLDCDEDIASARPLWQAYGERRIPFSLAIHASLLSDGRHDAFVREVATAGGSVLSHSMTHAPDWGGDYDHAVAEASKSADALEKCVGARPANAVSPFHQTPDYAVRALIDCGYLGCIGGTNQQYPETVIARGGAVAGHSGGFAFHTQQCMLHGDCLVEGSDPMAGYRTAFDRAYESRSLFGYLDHPFSPRYQYGWESEAARLSAHESLLAHIRSRAENPVFLSEDEALAFLRQKAGVRVRQESGAFRLDPPGTAPGHLTLCVAYRGQLHRLATAGLVLAAHR